MNCKHCNNKLPTGAKFCNKCGSEIRADSSEKHSATDTMVIPTDSSPIKNNTHIKCGNCDYIGPGEMARSVGGEILAWICIFFAPIITILYFALTHKYRCPKCKSTFLGVKNKEGVFVGQKGGAGSALSVFVIILIGIAIIGILASVVLASLNTARAKGADAAIKADINNSRAQAELFYNKTGSSYEDLCTDPVILGIKNSINNVGGTFGCSAISIAYRISSSLKTSTTTYYCVDSTGAAATITTAPWATSCNE